MTVLPFTTALVLLAGAATVTAVALPLLSRALRAGRRRSVVALTTVAVTGSAALLLAGQSIDADVRDLPAATAGAGIAAAVLVAAAAGRFPAPVRHRATWAGWAALVAVVHLLLDQPPLSGQVLTVALVGCAAAAVRLPAPAGRTGVARRRAALGVGLLSVLGGLFAWRADVSRLPADFALTPVGHHHVAAAGAAPRTVDHLIAGPAGSRPVRTFDVTARTGTRTVAGHSITTWTYEVAGRPGHNLLRVVQGDRVVVHLHNQLPVATTIHWHGIAVPDSADGVAGLTQNAVAPGATYTYAFDADEPCTYWYHSHQDSAVQVGEGLFGAVVVDPAPGARGLQATYGRSAIADVDRVLTLHTWAGTFTATDDDQAGGATAAPGQQVRLRLLNTDNTPATVTVTGAAFTVAALDGHALNQPTPLTATAVTVPASGRVDLTYAQPLSAVRVDALGDAGKAAYRTAPAPSTADPGPTPAQGAFDLTTYGTPAGTGVDGRPTLTTASRYDKAFTARIANRLMFFDGSFGAYNVINDKLYPYGDMFLVDPGDTVKVTIVNRSFATHPMHLHGHSYTVLAYDGRPLRGSPVQLDSLNVRPGETWTVAFRADNPGLWMFHCHDLDHAAAGMDLMIGYRGVTTVYRAGSATGNHR